MTHFGTQRAQALVQGGPVLGADAAARHGVQLADLLRGGVLLPQGGARVSTGETAYELMQRLFPLCRSLTGDGVRATFDILSEHIPITRTEVPSGTQVFDWIVPDEWNIRDAYVAAPDGTRVIDFRESSLHVVGYSEPVRDDAAARAAARAPVHAARAAGPDPVPHVVLLAHVGLLPAAPPPARSSSPATTRS